MKESPHEISVRKSPTQQRARVTVDGILEAAQLIISKEGYDYATTNHIAEIAGVSIGTVYQYFPRKEAIVAALVEQLVVTMSEPIRRYMLESMQVPLARCMPTLIGMVLNSRRQMSLLLRRLPRDATKLCEDSVPFTSERFLFKTTSVFFKSHLGEFRIDDIDMAIYVSEYLCIGVIDGYLADPTPKLLDEQVVEHLSDTILKFLTR